MERRQKIKKQRGIKSKIGGTKERPRLSVFRSNRFIYAQLIDDQNGKTLLGISEKELENKSSKTKEKQTKTVRAKNLGLILAKKATKKGIKRVLFQRGRYPYKGRLKAFVEGVCEELAL